MNITILGATGMIGRILTREIARSAHAVTAIVRSPENARTILPSSVNIVQGDVSDASTLGPVMAADVVLVSLAVDPASEKPGSFHPETDGLKNVLRAAQKGPRPRILYVSSLLQAYRGLGWWVLDLKREALELVKESGLPYTVFYPSNFFENLPHNTLRGKTLSLIGKPKHQNWWVAAEDFGRQIVTHLNALPNESREYAIQGPEAMGYDEAARRYAAAYRAEDLKVAYAPEWILSLIGRFVRPLGYAVNISRVINRFPETFEATATWDELGKPRITVEDFARAMSARAA